MEAITMSFDNIQSCMKLQRLKLFAKLTGEGKVWHADNECCLQK